MDLHTAGNLPDWETVNQYDRNAFQVVASETAGIATPANAISLVGLGLVLDGSRHLLKGDYRAGIIEIGVGRTLDLVDGAVASKTGTKSPLGAGVDAVFDKVGMAAGLGIITHQNLAPKPVIAAHFAQNIANSAITMSAKKNGYTINPSKEGKLAMAAQGFGIGLHTIGRGLLSGKSRTSLDVVAYGLDAAAIYFGIVATKGYYNEVKGKS